MPRDAGDRIPQTSLNKPQQGLQATYTVWSTSFTYWRVSRREWMGMGVAAMIMNGYEMDHSLIPYV